MKRIYSGCGACARFKNNTSDMQTLSFGLLAFDSKDEAYGWAMREIKDRLPSSEGWNTHEVFLHELTLADLRKAVALLEPPADAQAEA